MHSSHYPALNIGTTLANFSSEGNIPDLSEKLMGNVKVCKKFSTQSLATKVCTNYNNNYTANVIFVR